MTVWGLLFQSPQVKSRNLPKVKLGGIVDLVTASNTNYIGIIIIVLSLPGLALPSFFFFFF